MFRFFIQSHRKGILTFSGTYVNEIKFDPNGPDSIYCIRKFENGDYKNKPIITKHPLTVYKFIKGKKSWGLWVQQWSDGIVDWTFKIEEIESLFIENNIDIPESLWKDFLNVIEQKKLKRNKQYLKSLSINR
jgi:hypothetical protein